MSTHYYALREDADDKQSPVKMIMKTEGYTFCAAGLYRPGDDMTPTYLSHISQWDYDILDAFGVKVIEPCDFKRLMDKLYA